MAQVVEGTSLELYNSEKQQHQKQVRVFCIVFLHYAELWNVVGPTCKWNQETSELLMHLDTDVGSDH